MKAQRSALFAFALLATLPVHAGLIVIEPDDFQAGTQLSGISQHVTIMRTNGQPVFSDEIASAEITTTGVLGERAFALERPAFEPASSWMADPNFDVSRFDTDAWSGVPYALQFSFHDPVTFVSVLAAEIRYDSGEPTTDNVKWLIYDSNGYLVNPDLISFENPSDDSNVVEYLGTTIFDDGLEHPAYPIWIGQFHHSDIRHVIIYGETEPTLVDHLTFRLRHDVPEPSTAALLSIGLLGALLSRRRPLCRQTTLSNS